MKYIVETYNGDIGSEDIVDRREFADAPPPIPNVGDYVYLEFENPSYREKYGPWWLVKSRRFLWFGKDSGVSSVLLSCEPRDPDQRTVPTWIERGLETVSETVTRAC